MSEAHTAGSAESGEELLLFSQSVACSSGCRLRSEAVAPTKVLP